MNRFIFSLASLILISFLATASVQAQPGRQGSGERLEQTLATLQEEVGLTDEQLEQARVILVEQGERRRAAMQRIGQGNREAMRAEMQALQQETNEQIETLLTPEQVEKYRVYQAIQQQQRGRGQGGPERGGQQPGQQGGSGAGASSAALIGTVRDASSGEGLPSASVAVWQLPDASRADTTLLSGAITTPEGTFRIEGIPAGTYRVVVSFVGYVAEAMNAVEVGATGPVTDLGTITLTPDVTMLGTVDVIAQRDRVEIQIDRTVYNVADDPVAQGGTATTVLETIPSVDVDVDGNVSLRGVGNVAILINGRPAPISRDFLAAYLQSLPAGTLERVEVIPNPSARYEPDGMGGILNLVLKDDTDLGLGGAVTLGADTQGGYNATGLITYGQGPLSLSASYGYRQSVRDADGLRFRINRYLDPTTTLDQTSLDERDRGSHFANLTADWALSPNSTLTASVQGGLRNEAENEVTSYIERDADGNLILDGTGDPVLDYERLALETGEGWNGSVRLGFRQDFGTASNRESAQEQGGGRRGFGGRGFGGRGGGSQSAGLGSHSLSIEARYNASDNDDVTDLVEQLLDGTVLEQQQTSRTNGRNEASFQVDYSRPIGDARLELGYKGEIEMLASDFSSETLDEATGLFVPDVSLNNAFDYDQQIHAAYLQLARQFGALGIQTGLRAETAQTTFTLENTSEALDNNYMSLFPSAFLTYEVAEGTTLKASYSRRINRPRTYFLNPFPSVDDPLNVRQGNPALRPEYVDAVELGLVQFTSFGSLQLTPYYRRTTDIIRRIQTLSEDGVTINTFENLDTSDSYGVELISSFNGSGVLDGLRGFASVEGYRVQTDGTSVDADLENDSFGWGGRLNATYGIRDGLDLQTNLRYRAPMDTEQGRVGARTFFDVALRQRFLNDRASLSIQARDPLGLARFDSIIDQPLLYQEFERSFGASQVGFTFTYAFGNNDQQRRQRSDRQGGSEGGGDFEEIDL